MDADSLRLDGNAASGLLGEIFGFEMSAVLASCAGCEKIAPIGALMTYRHEMGTILRCEGCDNVLMQITQIRGKYRLNLNGLKGLEFKAEIH